MTTQTGSVVHDTIAPSGLVWLKELANRTVDLLFPPYCIACQRFGAWLCAGCSDGIEVIHPPICLRCGLPLEGPASTNPSPAGETAPQCNHCSKTHSQVDRYLAYAFLSGPLHQAIHQLKYKDLRALAGPLGQLMAQGWTRLSSECDHIDVIVPVPLHAARQRKRGYNQADLLARELGSHLQRPVVNDCLMRIKATVPQVDLDAQERWLNVRDAFRCRGEKLVGRRVLLIDDVCTTGSTLEAASAALRDGGASFIWAYTLARAKR